MVCIYCGGETQVINSRSQKRYNHVWRRRRCAKCGAVFTSVETAELSKSLVIKNKGNLQPFLRDTLFISIYESLKHRKSALRDATALTETIIGKLEHHIADGVINRDVLVQAAYLSLKRFDKAAAMHYQAYHP